MAEDKKAAAPASEHKYYINISAVDQSFPDEQGDHKIIPPGFVIHSKNMRKGALEKAPWTVEFKGDLSKVRVVQ